MHTQKQVFAATYDELVSELARCGHEREDLENLFHYQLCDMMMDEISSCEDYNETPFCEKHEDCDY